MLGMLSKLSINNTNFTKNKAARDGGAIKWMNTQPCYHQVIFKENKAIYGDDVASIPIRMNLTIYDMKAGSYLTINRTSIPEIENVISGNNLHYRIEIKFLDFNNLVVSSLDSHE